MADDPENLVLIQLREMRAELKDIRTTLDVHTQTLERHSKRLDAVLEAAVLASGYGNLAVHKFDNLGKRVERLESKVT